ncbi:MAG: TFIIB-type zinc ribbon-containing protein [Nitrososphaeraceae archaeon]|nr:TFIIB-type zinc ribbon-containing protein [Nitrososphaeraceae archaeon]
MICSVCKNGRPIADPESGELVCSDCGLVFSEKAHENRAEWRNFESESNDRARTGSPLSLAQHDMGLNTVIGKNNKDSRGQNIDPSMHSTMQRLRIYNFRSQAHTSTDRNLMRAFGELGRQRDKLGLSDAMIDKTAYIYRKALGKGLVRGRSTSAILAAAIYIACREMGAVRSLKDIGEITDVKRKVISRSDRILFQEHEMIMPVTDPMKCIAKIANKAKLSEKSKRMAIDVMKDLVNTEASAGKGPMSLAATILYLSCLRNDEAVSQKYIAEAAGVTEVTIRNRIKDLKSRNLSREIRAGLFP